MNDVITVYKVCRERVGLEGYYSLGGSTFPPKYDPIVGLRSLKYNIGGATYPRMRGTPLWAWDSLEAATKFTRFASGSFIFKAEGEPFNEYSFEDNMVKHLSVNEFLEVFGEKGEVVWGKFQERITPQIINLREQIRGTIWVNNVTILERII